MKARLSSKLFLILIAVYCVILGMSSFVENRIILPQFVELENREAKAHLQRILLAFENELEHLKILDQDWAQWDDTYEFVSGNSPEYLENNLPNSTFLDTKLNLFLIADTTGNVVFSKGFNLQTKKELPVSAFFDSALKKIPPELDTKIVRKDLAGIIETKAGPMLITSFAILTSENKGPSRGSLVMGRLLDKFYLENLQLQTQLPISLTPLDDLSPAQRSKLYLLPKNKAFLLDNITPQKVRIVSLLRDITDTPFLCLTSEMNRDVLSQGLRAARYIQIFLAISGGLLLLVLFILLRKLITSPLERLKSQVVTMSDTLEHTDFTPSTRNDEIGTLSKEFHYLLRRMEETKQRQIENSYYAGMSETAAGIIHNVRNSLTSIVGSLDDIKSICSQAPAANVTRGLIELRNPEIDPERKNDLIDFLRFSFSDLTTGVEQIGVHTNQAGQLVRNIEKVLSNYLSISHNKPILERICLGEIINSVELLISKRSSALMTIERIGDLDSIYVHGLRVTLIQIFQNLLMNSFDALERSGRQGLVTIKADQSQTDDDNIIVQVCDNGPGVSNENLARLFERDFSTKTHGGRGLGLHWCANALAAINGAIHASHNQPCGLCMTLTLASVPQEIVPTPQGNTHVQG